MVPERSTLKQVYTEICRQGPRGHTCPRMYKDLQLKRCQITKCLATLQNCKAVTTYKLDHGKQRSVVYVSTKYAKECENLRQFEAQKSKFLNNVQPDENAADTGLAPYFKTAISLSRANMIIEEVKRCRLIDDHVALRKKIVESEMLTYGHMMDRKVYLAILQNLHNIGYIRLITTVIHHNKVERKLCFICDPSIQPTDQIVKTAIQNCRLRAFLQQEDKKLPTDTNVITHNPMGTKAVREMDAHMRQFYIPWHAKKYGYLPKAAKCAMAHKLLWYLVYGYEGVSDDTPPTEYSPDVIVAAKTDAQSKDAQSNDAHTNDSQLNDVEMIEIGSELSQTTDTIQNPSIIEELSVDESRIENALNYETSSKTVIDSSLDVDNLSRNTFERINLDENITDNNTSSQKEKRHLNVDVGNANRNTFERINLDDTITTDNTSASQSKNVNNVNISVNNTSQIWNTDKTNTATSNKSLSNSNIDSSKIDTGNQKTLYSMGLKEKTFEIINIEDDLDKDVDETMLNPPGNVSKKKVVTDKNTLSTDNTKDTLEQNVGEQNTAYEVTVEHTMVTSTTFTELYKQFVIPETDAVTESNNYDVFNVEPSEMSTEMKTNIDTDSLVNTELSTHDNSVSIDGLTSEKLKDVKINKDVKPSTKVGSSKSSPKSSKPTKAALAQLERERLVYVEKSPKSSKPTKAALAGQLERERLEYVEKASHLADPKVYKDEMSWKRFLAPLPKYKEYPSGWCMLGDVVLSMPLVIFCNIIHLPFRLPYIEVLLADPIKKFYPIRHLPEELLRFILYRHTYAHKFHDCLVRLHFLGLVSLENCKLKVKSSAFIYVHQGGYLTDTTQSEPSYLHTKASPGVVFPTQLTLFNTFHDVENYWHDVKFVCIHTELGLNKDSNNTLDVRYLERRLNVHLKFITPKMVQPIISPAGDGLGAGGFDTAMFFHITRNWMADPVVRNKREILLDTTTEVEKGVAVTKTHRLSSLNTQSRFTLLDTTNATEKEMVTVVKHQAMPPKGGKGLKRKRDEEFEEALKKRREERNAKILTERLTKQRKRKSMTIYNKSRDQEARNFSEKERVVWTSQEDYALLLCKVTTDILCKNSRYIMVNWGIIRDILHARFPVVSKDKSSQACARRLRFILQNSQTTATLAAFRAELMQDTFVSNKYQSYHTDHLGTEDSIKAIFLDVLNYIFNKFKSGQYVQKRDLPTTFADLHFRYNVMVIGAKKEIRNKVETVAEIEFGVIDNIIHGHLSTQDKQSRAHEMYKTLTVYTDQILNKVCHDMQNRGIITKIKAVERKKYGVSCSFQKMKYHFQQRYYYLFTTWYHTLVSEEARSFLELLSDAEEDTRVGPDLKGGHVATIVSLFSLDRLNLQATLPDNILVYGKHDMLTKPFLKPFSKTDDDDASDDDNTSVISQYSDVFKRGQASHTLLSLARSHQIFQNKTGLNINYDVLVVNSCDVMVRLRENMAHESNDSSSNVLEISDVATSSENVANESTKSKSLDATTDSDSSENDFIDRAKSLEVFKGLMRFLPAKVKMAAVWRKLEKTMTQHELQQTKEVYAVIAEHREFGVKEMQIEELFAGDETIWFLISQLLAQNAIGGVRPNSF